MISDKDVQRRDDRLSVYNRLRTGQLSTSPEPIIHGFGESEGWVFPSGSPDNHGKEESME